MDPSRARILIVDDRRSNHLLLAEILGRSGFRKVLGATDPTRTLALCESFRPDIVLLDLYMPGMDGFAVLRDLRARRTDADFLPVLVLTADAAVEVRQRALASGAQDFLAKPLDPVEVVLRIRNLLETRGLHRALREEKAQLEERVLERTRELEEAQAEILERLAQAAELHDDDTGLHTRRVGDSAASLAASLGCVAELVERIRRTAPLHDIGKIAVPDAVLRKPGPLDAAERAQMQTHTLAGARILAGGRAESIRMAEQIALAHHERWDGSGYPRGLRAEEIPLAARIVAVADVFDALAHDRPYRGAWPEERALAEIRAGAGTHFDPRVVVALESCLEGGRRVA
jgi:putative two-component system response regulator